MRIPGAVDGLGGTGGANGTLAPAALVTTGASPATNQPQLIREHTTNQLPTKIRFMAESVTAAAPGATQQLIVVYDVTCKKKCETKDIPPPQ